MNVLLKIISAIVTFAPIIEKIIDLILAKMGKDKQFQETVKAYNKQYHGRPAEDVGSVNELQTRLNTPKQEDSKQEWITV